ncbi:MAG: phosphinothricin acetyltransferase [Crocinitomix sp. MedPE-SWsnd]|nr:MAG: phosphinothricin acetyltransferase [Crocinitomix sp. MedPE-SWsnd]
MIRPASPNDADQIVKIYNYYIKTSTVTFETELLSAKDFADRIATILEKYPYLVYEEDGQIIGYAYAGIFRTRIAYANSSESSVYVHKDHYRKGIAKKLYAQLLIEMKAVDLRTAIGGITLPNDASVKLHESFGFTKVAHFKEVGHKFDQWLDVGFWQLML